jgi:septum formation topological specificity factor MinE
MSFLGKMGKIFAGATAVPTTASSTRSVAKERLSVILASQRGSELLDGVNMEALQRDVMQVVKVRFWNPSLG